jgi:hypothetical protein
MNHAHGLPGLTLITFSFFIGMINRVSQSDILVYVQIFSYAAAGLYYTFKFLHRNNNDNNEEE